MLAWVERAPLGKPACYMVAGGPTRLWLDGRMHVPAEPMVQVDAMVARFWQWTTASSNRIIR